VYQRVRIDNLRGMDETTLELMVGDTLRRPMSQMTPPTMADLIALSEVPKPPHGLKTALRLFKDRVAREVADIPDGGELKKFLADLHELPAVRVPETLRSALRVEAVNLGRSDYSREQISDVIASWDGVEPEAFMVGKGVPAIAEPARVLKSRSERPSRGGRSTSTRKAAPARATRPVKLVDPERQDYLTQMIVERLNGYSERGLAENILSVGIAHKARAKYPDIVGREVLDALNALEERGVARKSAGRWVIERRW
jgi:hypothetical protein